MIEMQRGIGVCMLCSQQHMHKATPRPVKVVRTCEVDKFFKQNGSEQQYTWLSKRCISQP